MLSAVRRSEKEHESKGMVSLRVLWLLEDKSQNQKFQRDPLVAGVSL